MSILRNLLNTAASYVPTEWVTGDVITAEKLNHIEDGVELISDGNNMIINVEVNENDISISSIDATLSDIVDACIARKNVYSILHLIDLDFGINKYILSSQSCLYYSGDNPDRWECVFNFPPGTAGGYILTVNANGATIV